MSESRAKLGGLGRAGLGLLLALGMLALLAPVLAPYAPDDLAGPPLAAPSADHWLGTDDLGQDILSGLLYGARLSLGFGIVAALAATLIALTVGLVSGYARGWIDALLMRLVDAVLALPVLPLTIVIGAFLGAGLSTELLVVCLVMWARPAREIRAQVLSLRERGEVQAALAMGAGGAYVVTRHVAPRTLPLVMPQFVRLAKGAIMLEASLSFLGLGDPTAQSWGTMLYYAQVRSAFLTDAWAWWVLPPGLGIAASVVAFAFIGYAVEERGRPVLAGALGGEDHPGPTPTPAAPADRAPPPLEISDLVVEYDAPAGPVRAVDGVSFRVRAGEILGIIGESGSGKTTLAHTMLGLLDPPGRVSGGHALINGRNLSALSRADRRRILGNRVALVPQSAMNALNPVLRIRDQVEEAVAVHRGPGQARERAERALSEVGIPADRFDAWPHEFSGGMRQRVLIAMALVNEPDVIIADEVTSGLDVLTQADLLRRLAALRDQHHIAMVFITHDLAAVAGLADRLAVMQAGKIVEVGPAATVLSRPSHAYTRRLLAAGTVGPSRRAFTPPAGPPVLEVRDLGRMFAPERAGEGIVAVDDVSFVVHPGEAVGLVGASGAGKTTVARLVVGLERPDRGVVNLLGRDPAARDATERRAARRRSHLVFQDPYQSLAPHWRVERIVAEPLAIMGGEDGSGARGGERRARVVAALEAVALGPPDRFLPRFPHELSGGERQRVALARAAIHDPALIVADEPTSLLDASRREEVVAAMERLRETRGTAFLYITHDLGLARRFCDRLLIMASGRIVETGTAARIFADPEHSHTRALVEAANRAAGDGSVTPAPFRP